MENRQAVVPFSTFQVHCDTCKQRNHCLPSVIDSAELDGLNEIIQRHGTVARGKHIFWQGDALRSLYIIRSGTVKSFVTSADGTEQVLGFFLPGEMLGLDALQHKRHTSSAATLESTALCELPYARYERLCDRFPNLGKQTLQRCGTALSRDHELLLLLGQKGVDERFASFLLDLSQRMKRRGFSATEFELHMTRYDIANLLGMQAETISRTFTLFQRQGLLEVERRKVHIKDLNRLQSMVSFCNGNILQVVN